MEQEHKIDGPGISWEQAALMRLLDRGIREGMIRDDQLWFCLSRAKVSPEVTGQVYEELKALNVRVIEGVPEPKYTQDQRQTIRQLLEQLGSELSEREQMILKMRFDEGLDLTRIAEKMGLSRERVCQIEHRTIWMISRRKNFRNFYE